MADEYVDTTIIECNRLHSEEALSNNNENFANWTNNLRDVVSLDAGDKISVHNAMISERGAGQPSSIEIKGENLGLKKKFKKVVPEFLSFNSEIYSQYHRINYTEEEDEIMIRDDTANFTISYYKNADGHNYMQLPRRWWWRQDLNVNGSNYFFHDDAVHWGMSLHDPFREDSYTLFEDFYQLSGSPGVGNTKGTYNANGTLSKVKNDNSRYTIMIRDSTNFESGAATINPDRYLRDPENASYFIYKETKSITVNKGFNSPEFIAEDFSRQLQEVISTNVFEVRNPNDKSANPDRPGFAVPAYTTRTTQTYKPFICAGIYGRESDAANDTQVIFEEYIGGLNKNNGFEYLAQYSCVGCKRPELYDTGRKINLLNTVYRGIRGAEVDRDYDGSFNASYGTNGIITSLHYTEDNLTLFKNFIESQEKYPETYNIFYDGRTPYSPNDNITNSRWMHMNRYPNASMSLDSANASFAQLGWGGYVNPSWNATSNTKQLSSVVVPFQFDENQRDIFYAEPNENLGQKTYGCFGRTYNASNASQWIVVYPTPHNGSGSKLFNMLNGTTNIIEKSRKMGYDMHFTAPNTAWILPYSGLNVKPYNFDSRSTKIFNYEISANDDYALNTYQVETQYDRNLLYLGADIPKLNYDGTHFTFSDLHTALNRGNSWAAKVPFITFVPTVNDGFDDIVYKINPNENFEDWTPARMPYPSETSIQWDSVATNTYRTKKTNPNLEKWKIYDALCGINIEDFGLTENEWTGTLWDLLGFSYKQFHSGTNTRLKRIDNTNVNDLSVITTNATVSEGDTKIYFQNLFGVPMLKNMIPVSAMLLNYSGGRTVSYYPEIIQKTQSIQIVADNLPTRMLRGYYTIRSNILQNTPFIGGKVNNTNMPIISIVDKMNPDGDFYFQQESSLEFTITKPLRLASISCSVHDPDGSYANVSEQSTVLFKVKKDRRNTFNVAQELLQEQQPPTK